MTNRYLCTAGFLGLFSLLIGVGAGKPAGAANDEPLCGETAEVLIMFDRSKSMEAYIGNKKKIDMARDALLRFLPRYEDQIDFGLMLFPYVIGCSPGKVLVPPGPNHAQAVYDELFIPTYIRLYTPIAQSLDEAFVYMTMRPRVRPQHILLITDGWESCLGDPIASALPFRDADIPIHVIGFAAEASPADLNALAAAGGTAGYVVADDEAGLDAALQAISAKVICCGNGLVEPHEQCDIAIPPGQPGACPTDAAQCDDGDPCTTARLEGTACQTRCVFDRIPGCINGCGNGVLDPHLGELCDIAIPPGLPGACPRHIADCDDGDPCTIEEIRGQQCTLHCVHLRVTPQDDRAAWDEYLGPGGLASRVPAYCYDPCHDVICPEGYICIDGICRPCCQDPPPDPPPPYPPPAPPPPSPPPPDDGQQDDGITDAGAPYLAGGGCDCAYGGAANANTVPWLWLLAFTLWFHSRRARRARRRKDVGVALGR